SRGSTCFPTAALRSTSAQSYADSGFRLYVPTSLLTRIQQLRVIWNPQAEGSPNVAGNSPQAYYPGDRYVDVVGNDIYDIGFRPQWAANERLYRAHPSKPYAFPEWGLWGIDDPAFIRSMAKFVRTHRRVELLSWFNGQASGG